VQEAPSSVTVTAPGLTFTPANVDIAAGGSVTWSFAALPHDVAFSGFGAPENVPVLSDGTATRTFPNSGVYPYVCTLHAGMVGSVIVH
jgi:plastocyanin